MTIEELLERAERARQEGTTLHQRFRVLREMQALEDDFRRVTRGLAAAMRTEYLALNTENGLRYLLQIAEELIVPPAE